MNLPAFHPMTYDGADHVDDEPVHLRLRSAREVQADEGGMVETDMIAGVEPVLSLVVFPFNTWQMVKIQIKQHWPGAGLERVPDAHIRLLYKGVELRSSSLIDD